VKEVLERFPTVLALVTSAVFFMTVVHEWAYFLVVGPHLQTTMSSVDYLSNAILWLPWHVLLLLVALVVAFLVLRGAGAVWGRRGSRRGLWIVVGVYILLTLILAVAVPALRLSLSVTAGAMVLVSGQALFALRKGVGLPTRRVMATITAVLFFLSGAFVTGKTLKRTSI
jgi:hypothetical protein